MSDWLPLATLAAYVCLLALFAAYLAVLHLRIQWATVRGQGPRLLIYENGWTRTGRPILSWWNAYLIAALQRERGRPHWAEVSTESPRA